MNKPVLTTASVEPDAIDQGANDTRYNSHIVVKPPVYPRLGMRWSILVILVGLLLFVFCLSLALGSVSIPVGDVVNILLGGTPARATWTDIVFKFRLPKAITATLAGAGLSTGGLLMQTLFRNPLADPFVLGISSGASLGVALVVLGSGVLSTGTFLAASLGFLGGYGTVVAASLGAALVMMLVLGVAQRVQSSVTLLVLGLMFGYAVNAIVSLLLYFSAAERIQAYLTWTYGSFGGVTWVQIQVFTPILLIGLLISLFLSKNLNALLLGDDYARSMGLNVKVVRIQIIIASAILAGAVTAYCGPIGFIGLAVPHLCRSLFKTADHRVLVPTTILMGALLALVADIIAQAPGTNAILPLNAVTSLIGAPVVIWVILKQKNLKASF